MVRCVYSDARRFLVEDYYGEKNVVDVEPFQNILLLEQQHQQQHLIRGLLERERCNSAIVLIPNTPIKNNLCFTRFRSG